MSELDDKLRVILIDLRESQDNNRFLPHGQKIVNPTSKAIKQIKQAFIDSNYVRIMSVDEETRKKWEHNDRKYGMMTGEEWYDRFRRELNTAYTNKHNDQYISPSTNWVRDVAKRAAGLVE